MAVMPVVVVLFLGGAPVRAHSLPLAASPPGLAATYLAKTPPNLSGTYRGRVSAVDDAKRVFLLNLAPNGTAVLRTIYAGNNDATEKGHWSQDGTKLIVTFDPIGPHAAPRPITFRYRDRSLRPVDWDSSEWGRTGPPILYRESHPPAPVDM